jgi:hypothetical protein
MHMVACWFFTRRMMTLFLNTSSRWFAAAFTALSLAACGGGDSTTTSSSDSSDKYVGTWKRCNIYAVPMGANLAYSDRLVIAKVSATSYSSAGAKFDHTDTACSSTGVPIAGDSGTTVFTIVGSKTVGTNLVDTLTYPNGSGTSKDIAYVNLAGPTLQLGNPSSSLDAAGFPTALDLVRFAKQ